MSTEREIAARVLDRWNAAILPSRATKYTDLSSHADFSAFLEEPFAILKINRLAVQAIEATRLVPPSQRPHLALDSKAAMIAVLPSLEPLFVGKGDERPVSVADTRCAGCQSGMVKCPKCKDGRVRCSEPGCVSGQIAYEQEVPRECPQCFGRREIAIPCPHLVDGIPTCTKSHILGHDASCEDGKNCRICRGSFEKMIKCPTCDGGGSYGVDVIPRHKKCPQCDANGTVECPFCDHGRISHLACEGSGTMVAVTYIKRIVTPTPVLSLTAGCYGSWVADLSPGERGRFNEQSMILNAQSTVPMIAGFEIFPKLTAQIRDVVSHSGTYEVRWIVGSSFRFTATLADWRATFCLVPVSEPELGFILPSPGAVPPVDPERQVKLASDYARHRRLWPGLSALALAIAAVLALAIEFSGMGNNSFTSLIGPNFAQGSLYPPAQVSALVVFLVVVSWLIAFIGLKALTAVRSDSHPKRWIAAALLALLLSPVLLVVPIASVAASISAYLFFRLMAERSAFAMEHMSPSELIALAESPSSTNSGAIRLGQFRAAGA